MLWGYRPKYKEVCVDCGAEDSCERVDLGWGEYRYICDTCGEPYEGDSVEDGKEFFSPDLTQLLRLADEKYGPIDITYSPFKNAFQAVTLDKKIGLGASRESAIRNLIDETN